LLLGQETQVQNYFLIFVIFNIFTFYKTNLMSLKTNLILSLAILFATVINLQAQELSKDSTGKKFYYEQGINCTQFVKQYLSFNDNFSSNMPYLLTGNIGYKKIGLRYGTNYQISNSKTSTSGTSSSSSGISTITPPLISESNTVAIDNRIGFYYRKVYFNRLNLNVGVDYLISTTIVKTKNESTTIGGTSTNLTKSNTKNTTNARGYGAFLALNYKVWKNVSVGTEAALYYVNGTTKQEGSSFTSETPLSSFGTYTYLDQSVSGKSTFKETQIRIPLTLYVYFKF
jgi:hypothetical protein